MQRLPTELPDVFELVPQRFGDERGWFVETYQQSRFAALGLTDVWVQDNHSYSAQKGTLRGLHYQRPPYEQAKLVRCIRGTILDVAVDIRKSSPFYGCSVSRELSAANGHQLYIPIGFLHGFLTLTAECEVEYKCSQPYAPQADAAVSWCDPFLNIDWRLSGDQPILSQKDQNAPMLSAADTGFE